MKELFYCMQSIRRCTLQFKLNCISFEKEKMKTSNNKNMYVILRSKKKRNFDRKLLIPLKFIRHMQDMYLKNDQFVLFPPLKWRSFQNARYGAAWCDWKDLNGKIWSECTAKKEHTILIQYYWTKLNKKNQTDLMFAMLKTKNRDESKLIYLNHEYR